MWKGSGFGGGDKPGGITVEVDLNCTCWRLIKLLLTHPCDPPLHCCEPLFMKQGAQERDNAAPNHAHRDGNLAFKETWHACLGGARVCVRVCVCISALLWLRPWETASSFVLQQVSFCSRQVTYASTLCSAFNRLFTRGTPVLTWTE